MFIWYSVNCGRNGEFKREIIKSNRLQRNVPRYRVLTSVIIKIAVYQFVNSDELKNCKKYKKGDYAPSHRLNVNLILSNIIFMIFANFNYIAVNTVDKLRFVVFTFLVLSILIITAHFRSTYSEYLEKYMAVHRFGFGQTRSINQSCLFVNTDTIQ